MSIEDLTTIDQVTAFLEGTQRVIFEVPKDKDLRYQWVQRTLVKFHYLSLSRQGRADPLPHEAQRLFASATHPPDQTIQGYRATGTGRRGSITSMRSMR